MKLIGFTAISLLSFGACADTGNAPGNKFDINVAPLTLPGLTDACYDLTVYNSATVAGADTVWAQSNICASQYGDNSGSISYVGTCDAQAADVLDGTTVVTAHANTVRLVLDTLWTDAAHDAGGTQLLDTGTNPDFANPCTSTKPCDLVEPCQENADTFVEFNITVMRSADQGFFDVAVNFSDIFCSAKFDCGADDLLFDSTGNRGNTFVLGFACTSGTQEASDTTEPPTYLYLNNIAITCDEGPAGSVNVVGTDGNQLSGAAIGERTGLLNSVTDAPNPLIFQSAVYRGSESLSATFNKDYWNVAVGINPSVLASKHNCHLVTSGTAADEPWTGLHSASDEVYPHIDWNVDLQGTECAAGDSFDVGDGSNLKVGYNTLGTAGTPFDNCGWEKTGDVFTAQAASCP